MKAETRIPTCARVAVAYRAVTCSGFGFRPSFSLRPSDFGLATPPNTPLP